VTTILKKNKEKKTEMGYKQNTNMVILAWTAII